MIIASAGKAGEVEKYVCGMCGGRFEPRDPRHRYCDDCYWERREWSPQYRRFVDRLRNPLPAILLAGAGLLIGVLLQRCGAW